MFFKNKPFLLSVFILNLGSIPCAMSMNIDEEDNNTDINIPTGDVTSFSRGESSVSNLNMFNIDNNNEETMNEQSNENNSNIYSSQNLFQSMNYRQPVRFNPQSRQVLQEEHEQKNNLTESYFENDDPAFEDIDEAINIVVNYFEDERFVPNRVLNDESRLSTAVRVFSKLYSKEMQGIISHQNNNNTSIPLNMDEFSVNNNNHTDIKKSVAEEMLATALVEVKEHFDVARSEEENRDTSNDSAIHKVLKILQGSKEEPQLTEMSSLSFQHEQINSESVSKNKQCTFALIAYVQAMRVELPYDVILNTIQEMNLNDNNRYNDIKQSMNNMQQVASSLLQALNTIDQKLNTIGNSNNNNNGNETDDNLPTWKKYQLGGGAVGCFVTLLLVGGIQLFLSSGSAAKKNTNSPTKDIYEENLVQGL